MAAETVGDMTVKELKQLIAEEVDRRLGLQERRVSTDRRSVAEINESIKRNRRMPRPGTPSTLQLLREDRDR